MLRKFLTAITSPRERREDGITTIVVALTMVSLLIVSAIVVDFGLVRFNRQANKSAADSAVMAGLRAADGGTSDVYPERAVCAALAYLQANAPALTGLAADGCSPAVVSTSTMACNTSSPSGKTYDQSITTAGVTYRVWIKSPYLTTDSTGGPFSDESLATLSSDTSQMNGCDQLAVIIKQTRNSLFGDLATSSAITTTVRSVGRVAISPGSDAPALLLLKRTGCPVLLTGSNSGDSTIRVFGAVSSDGRTSAGTIHSDSDGSGCSGGSNQNIFLGKAGNGIVALAAPLASNPTQADSSKPGQISSVWGMTNPAAGVGYDAAANVFGSGAIDEAGISAGTKAAPFGRGLVTRKLIDDRYFDGVKGAISIANSNIFDSSTGLTVANAPGRGYTVLSNCNPTAADLVAAGITIFTPKIFVDCTTNAGYKGTVQLAAGEIVFNGVVNPGSVIPMPNATKVYVFGLPSKDAISLGGGGGISMHTSGGNLSGSLCTTATRGSTNKALLVIKQGGFKETNGGVLQMCNTTVIMLGGQANGCVPATAGTAPTQTPCAGTMGEGQLSQTGGSVDWTAPNSLDVTVDSTGNPTAAALSGWRDVNGPEDLAFWSESAGNNSSTTYNMNGQGGLHTVGVYMVPNADSFIIGGGAAQQLVNAQYIATSIALNGAGTSINMRVDPNSVVTLPELNPFTLVR